MIIHVFSLGAIFLLLVSFGC